MKNKLTNKDIVKVEKFITKCTDIQLNLWIGRLNDELYNRLDKRRKKSSKPSLNNDLLCGLKPAVSQQSQRGQPSKKD